MKSDFFPRRLPFKITSPGLYTSSGGCGHYLTECYAGRYADQSERDTACAIADLPGFLINDHQVDEYVPYHRDVRAYSNEFSRFKKRRELKGEEHLHPHVCLYFYVRFDMKVTKLMRREVGYKKNLTFAFFVFHESQRSSWGVLHLLTMLKRLSEQDRLT